MTKLAASKPSPFIRVERVSIRLFSTLIFIFSAIVAIIIFLVVSSQARNAALELQKNSLSRVIHVATEGVLVDLRDELVTIGNSLQRRPEIRQSLKTFYKSGDSASLTTNLDDPLINGFVGAADIELVKLRVYNKEYQFIAESSRGMQDLEQRLPEFIFASARIRTGAESLKAIGGLWTSNKYANNDITLYSLLLPIGGLRIQGYLELVIDPLFNLMDVAKITQKPLTIYNMHGDELEYHSPVEDMSGHSLEEIEYTLVGADNKNAFRMVLLEDVSDFNHDMELNRMVALISFIMLTLLAILIAIVLMNRFLFKPIRHMITQMRRVANGDLTIEVDHRGLKDFHELAQNFNTMREIVHASMQNLERMSLLDGLSGIGNRRLFDQTLENEWRRHKRKGTPLALILCDIDFFKQFNDSYGHLEGDESIQQVAMAITRSIHRPTDLACRYGGEEFALILPETPLKGALHIAGLIRDQVAQMEIPHKSSSISEYLTLSMGIATVPLENIESIGQLIKAADTALYLAKERGRNRVEVSKG